MAEMPPRMLSTGEPGPLAPTRLPARGSGRACARQWSSVATVS
jgi:hypothetical protein